jgi:hypothetical protein
MPPVRVTRPRCYTIQSMRPAQEPLEGLQHTAGRPDRFVALLDVLAGLVAPPAGAGRHSADRPSRPSPACAVPDPDIGWPRMAWIYYVLVRPRLCKIAGLTIAEPLVSGPAAGVVSPTSAKARPLIGQDRQAMANQPPAGRSAVTSGSRSVSSPHRRRRFNQALICYS